MSITSLNDITENVLSGKLTFESRDQGRLWGFLKGPYYQHNRLVRHAEQLKKENTETAPRYFRLFPLGGGYNVASDAVLFAIWQLLLVYPLAAIGAACLCRNVVNIVNATILAVLMVTHVSCMWLASKNWKKLKRSWYVAKIAMKNLFGAENRLTGVNAENLHQNEHLSRPQKQIILSKLTAEKRESGRAVIMIVTDSYWKSKVLDPIIALSAMGVLYLISLILQIEFYRTTPGS